MALVWLLWAGCGDGGAAGSTPGDGAEDAGWSIAAPASPAPAALPQIAPCPDGWTERAIEGSGVCEPWASDESSECPSGSARFPGDAACTPIGTPCGDDDYATDLPTDVAVLHVMAGAIGGDGTRAKPFGSIARAFAEAAPGTVVALSKGTFDEALHVPAGVTLWGACVEQTILTNNVFGSVMVSFAGPDAAIRNLTVGYAPRVGIAAIGDSVSVTIESVVVEQAMKIGVFLDDGATATVREVVVRDTAEHPVDGAGYGITAQRFATVDVERAVIERNHGPSVAALRSGTVRLHRAVVRDTVPSSGGGLGIGAGALRGSRLEIADSVLERTRLAAVFAEDERTSVVVERSVIRDTSPRLADGVGGMGVLAHPGSHVRVSRTLLERSSTEGIQLSGATGEITDVLVVDTRRQEMDQLAGRGLALQGGATARLSRLWLLRNEEAALYVADLGTMLEATDLTISQTRPRADGTFGLGALFKADARVNATRMTVEASHEVGIIASHGAVASIEDLVVRGTLPRPSDLEGGRGLWAQEGASVTILRSRFEDNRMVGLGANGDGVSLVAEDVTVQRTLSRASDGLVGRALNVQSGASAELRRASFEDNEEVTVLVSSRAALTASDVVIRRSLPRTCATTTCTDFPAGIGLGIYASTVSVERFQIAEAALCGVQVARGGSADLTRGEVRSSLVGACVQVPEYDFERLSNEVRYVDNGTNLDARDLPVPDVVEATPTL